MQLAPSADDHPIADPGLVIVTTKLPPSPLKSSPLLHASHVPAVGQQPAPSGAQTSKLVDSNTFAITILLLPAHPYAHIVNGETKGEDGNR